MEKHIIWYIVFSSRVRELVSISFCHHYGSQDITGCVQSPCLEDEKYIFFMYIPPFVIPERPL